MVRASADEIVTRIPSGVAPRSDSSTSVVDGDNLFHAWTCSERPDRSVDMHLTEMGTRVMIGLHKSWIEIVRAGNNLIIDYTIFDPILLKHLLGQLKTVVGRKLERLILIDYQTSLASLRQFERENPINPLPVGFALSTFKKLNELSQLSFGSAHRLVLQDTGQPKSQCDHAYSFIYRSGLL
jgi:hypothetical protein